MGDLDETMSEQSIMESFQQMGENIVSVKIILNKITGAPAGYCFVEFHTIEASQRALLRLGGKPIPGGNGRRFKLNTATKDKTGGEEFSIFVGDLSDEVDDLALYECFHRRYPSTRGAKVVLGAGGVTRGFGFVRFGDQGEQLSALREMQNWQGLGNRPIRVSGATPRKQWEPPTSAGWTPNAGGGGGNEWDNQSGGAAAGPDYQAQWAQYYQQQQQYWQYQQQQQQQQNQWAEYWQQQQQAAGDPSAQGADPNAPPQPKTKSPDDPQADFDVESSNAETMARSDDFIKSLDDSQWFSELLNFPSVAG